jgi:envelope integrity protein B
MFLFGSAAESRQEVDAMTVTGKCVTCASAVVLMTAALTGGSGQFSAAALTPVKELASHRAVYDLKLVQARTNNTVDARGRILYDFSGNACEGYALQFRQVSLLDNGEGRTALSDMRSTTWEDGKAGSYVFKSQNRLNEQVVDTVDGRAERKSDKIAVTLTKPSDKSVDLTSAIAFPTDHVRRIIVAAREGKSVLEVPVYDGAETGEKVYNTLTVIGRAIPPDERVPTDAAAGKAELAGMIRWPVTVSYFDRAKTGGEQAPVYSIKFELYENGISRALVLDYNDFVISGELTTLEIRDSKPCN